MWRGSSELLFHIARVAIECVSDATGAADVPVQLAVKVRNDEEAFTSISGFRDFMTPEGLRDFQKIEFNGAFFSALSWLLPLVEIAPPGPQPV
jgi:hypothetical protein